MRRLWRLLPTAILLSLFIVMPAERQPLAQEVPQRPNVLFILTDDQAPEDLTPMSNDVQTPMLNVQSLLVNEGTSFSNAFATTPICCPSRVSFMRGQYAHNHGVLTNQSVDQGGYNRFIELGVQDSTVATWLDEAGYDTFYAGKFLNGYEGSNTDVAPGWDRWYAFASKIREQYTINKNGTLQTYTQDQQHETYYLRDRAEAFVRNHAQEGDAPWFAWVSTHAPHGPNTIAPEFRGSYDGTEMPRQPPSYNEADVSDKPAWVQALPLLDDDCSTDEGKLDCHEQVVERWRGRQESLMSVDVMVKDLVNTLAETNQLDHTYIVFATDNGFLLYRHRIYSKGSPYEESQGIPFVVRGPGVGQGVVSDELVANIDLAPTIAEWAGIEAPAYVDGRSLVPLLEGTATTPWRRYLLFEFFRGLNDSNKVVRSYGGVRTAGGETYVEYRSEDKEYYDLGTDPWQERSAHAAPENADRLGTLSEVLSGLKGCAGAGCRAADRDCSTDQADNDGDGVVDEPGEPCGDPQPPDTTIDASPESITSSTSATFTFSSSEENSTFECSLDGASFAACNPEDNTLNSKTYDSLGAGEHTFSVRAIDQGGFADPTPASRTWKVDTTAPTLERVAPIEGATAVSPSTNVRAFFSETMDEVSVEATDPTAGKPTTYFLARKTTTGTSAPIPATVTYVETATNHKAILDPTDDLRPGATYVVTVTTAATDLAGNALDPDPNASGDRRKTWRFTVS